MPPTGKPAHFIVLETGQSIPLNTSPMMVGKQDPQLGIYPDIDLGHKTVGRRHAVLRCQNGNYTIEDNHSLTKTILNGVPLPPHQEYPLNDGDLLEFGSVKVRFAY